MLFMMHSVVAIHNGAVLIHFPVPSLHYWSRKRESE